MKKISVVNLTISIILTIFTLIGYSVQKYHVIDSLFQFKTLLYFVLLIVIFYVAIFLIYQICEKFSNNSSKLYDLVFDKHPFIIPFILFLLLGIPILIYYYPGTVQWDGMKQLDYYFNIIPWSNHHPVFPTILMGTCMKIGRFLINDNFGIFLYTFLQYIISCAVFSYVLVFLKSQKVPKCWIIITFLFFINPIWYINAYTLVKDTMFYLVFILFLISFIKYFYDDKKINLYYLLITSILVILFRNNGIYIIVITFFLMTFFRKNRKQYIKLCIFFLLFQVTYTMLISICGIRQGNIREMLSVPIQQTSRYVTQYQVTEDEQKIIENVFHINIEEIQQKYNPELSDPVKFHFYVKNKSEFIQYLTAWLKQFLKHPKVYFDSFIENYYGYFYPPKQEYKDGIVQLDIVKSKRVNTGYFNIYHQEKYEKNRTQIQNQIQWIRNLPVIQYFFNTGIYNWIFIIIVGYTLYKRNYETVVFSIPLFMALVFCFLSPVNAYIRYMNPLIVSLPIYFGIAIKTQPSCK